MIFAVGHILESLRSFTMFQSQGYDKLSIPGFLCWLNRGCMESIVTPRIKNTRTKYVYYILEESIQWYI